MPIIRKLLDLRTSKAITLPKSWLEYYEEEYKQKITKIEVTEENGTNHRYNRIFQFGELLLWVGLVSILFSLLSGLGLPFPPEYGWSVVKTMDFLSFCFGVSAFCSGVIMMLIGN